MKPTARTSEGRVGGLVRDGVASFRGIPFAAAPDGPLRFRPPAPPAAWDGVRDATAFGVAPPQLPPAPGVPPVWRAGDGLDCLTLNVWTPDLGAAGLPVMVWIYGGGWRAGSSSMPGYEATRLAAHGVVVVTFNYRVGFEGFGDLPGVPANRGIHDQIAALHWVRRNIAAFGGAPGNVTLFGESAGAASAAVLLTASPARGLFHRAIAQSVPAGFRTVAEAGHITGLLAAETGVPPTREGFATLPPETILAIQDEPLKSIGPGLSAFVPVIDGDLITALPWDALRDGAARDIDLICGFTHDEYRLFIPPRPPGAVPPGASPFGAKPTDSTRPGAKPQGTAPPGAKPPGSIPPGPVPPGPVRPGAKPRSATSPGARSPGPRPPGPRPPAGPPGGLPPGVGLAAVAASFGLGDGAVEAYRAGHPGATDADLFVVLMSDALFRMPSTWVAEAHARAGGRTWLYDFAWRGTALGACHTIDVPFTFGNAGTHMAARLLGSPPPDGFDALSERIRTAWTAFAATGDPGWPRYDLDHRRTRVWDTTPSDADDPLAASRRVWESHGDG